MKKLLVVLLCSVTLLSGCKKSSTTNYYVNVNVTGLVGTGVVLALNNVSSTNTTGTNQIILAVDANGVATFATPYPSGTVYAVTIIKQPALPVQTCALENATGTVSGTVSNINLTCAPIEFAYQVNGGGQTISPLLINLSTGALTSAGAAAPTGNSPQAMAIDSTGRYAFAVNYLDSTISPYLGNTTNGILLSSGSAVSTGTNSGPVAVAIDPLSKFVYTANSGNGGSISGYTIAVDGAITCVGSVSGVCPATPTATAGINPSSLTVANLGGAGEFLYVTNAGSNSIDEYGISGVSTQFGVLTPIASVATGNAPTSIVVSPKLVISGTTYGPFVYVLNSLDYTVSGYAINPNGSLTSVGVAVSTGGFNSNPSATPLTQHGNSSTGLYAFPNSIAFTPNGFNAYVVNPMSNTITAFGVSATGQLAAKGVVAVPGVSANPTPVSVAVDPSGTFAYVTNLSDNSITVFQINPDGSLGTSSSALFGNQPVSILTATN